MWSDRHRPQCDVYVGFLLVLLSCHRKQIPPHPFRISEDTHPSPFFFGSEAASVIPHEGAFDGVNPVQDARIPRNAREARETFADGIEAIPTPGHTVGSACYVYRSPHGKTYLFTGDTIFPSGDSWGTLVLVGSGGSASDLKRSLLLLRALEPDVVISSGSVGRSPVQAIDARQWQEIIGNAIDLLP